VVVAVEVFFLRQTPAERQVEEEVRELEYLRAAESPPAEPVSLRRPSAVEAEDPRPALHAAEKPQSQSGVLLEQHQVPSRNTIAAEADKLAVLVALTLVSPFLAYSDQLDGPGTPFNASLLISNEIL
jgi:hypothetical protein